MLALILLNTSNFCICSIKNVEKIPVTMTATTNMATVKEIGGGSVVNSGGCEAMKYTENVIGDFGPIPIRPLKTQALNTH